ncbi:uncharacterized protein LOC111286137 isoform X8 [Durio zibethinus]|uniref:Uncharacterized protein LOC111286137 isoform X8 n=1 Tax=Durio zibethinus TaxID=66656 RepID=A0A6P5XU07_DURZI|nr:uncharacterized protein LOC111286137 isoform X8 [Durio zibethinus]
MSNITDQIEEIKTLISSNSKTNQSLGYSTLLHLQEQSSDSPSIQALAQSSRHLIALIVSDIHDEDEEIAAQALKCLGFMIYHPCLVATIPAEDGRLVLESLAKLITFTKMKSVCNLGVWCISTQQFDATLLAAFFDTLLQAVVHALDNPIGSLSTTFEAMQAVAKLASNLSEMMRESSHLWTPPIYRRLLSIDKRERDMSERCLLKIRSTILPPPISLSKAIIQDMRKKLLTGMKDFLDKGMKVQTVMAWGWFICFLGSDALKNRHLVNDMLKVPEQTFSDYNPQVQIASLVAWEGLIDALVHPQILACNKNATLKNEIQQLQTSPGKSSELQLNGFSKSLKLIMTPLIGIISSKCDVSVHFSCLNTWRYLLHKLDTSVNSPSVMKVVLDPMFQAIFKIGAGSKSIWRLWDLCLDLLDDCTSANCSDLNSNSKDQKDLTLWIASDSLKESFVSSERKLEQAFEVWKSLYGSVSATCFKSSATNTFGGDLCAMLNWCFDENGSMFQSKSELGLCYKDLVPACLSFSSKVVECILKQKLTSDTSSCGSGKECVGVCNRFSGINNILEFSSRVMKFLYINMGTEPTVGLVSSRVFSALLCFISCLHLKQDILSFFEIISCPLLQWLSQEEIQDESARDQLGILWAECLNCLQRSQPPLTFDSSFLKFQACLLERTLGHPNTSISDPTITFWNSTYGKQIKLEYPQNLLHVLDKLSRNGRINLYNRSKSFLATCCKLGNNTAPQSCKVTATQNRSSKRVELMESMIGKFNQKDKPPPHPKRKRLELTEHQKEVRQAQQGRQRDCCGHGPGIRTYTSLDFSQGNEDSQESQDIRDSEAILEMLRRVA